jgi:hypothetical protein
MGSYLEHEICQWMRLVKGNWQKSPPLNRLLYIIDIIGRWERGPVNTL